jgi:selenide,water dikinase
MRFAESPRAALLFDPQTSGGLLAAVPADLAQALLAALTTAGQPAAIIGHATPGLPLLTTIP